MKTSFKKAMKCFLKSLPGISYSTHKGSFVEKGERVVREVFGMRFFVQGFRS